jgi:RNA polymerase sigma-70 factor (ECF subfamily)
MLHAYPTEKMLLAGLREGQSAAVAEWYRLYKGKISRLIQQKISVTKDAEEIVQDTFLNCLRHLPLFRGECSIDTWMARIAHHEVADYFRRKYAKKVLKVSPLSDLIDDLEIENAHQVAGHVTQEVKAVLAQMSQEMREILLMKYVDERKVDDIAHDLGKTVKAVESLLFRARRDFRGKYASL